MNLLKKTIVGIFFVTIVTTGAAVEIHVAPNGNDINPGMLLVADKAPPRTVSKTIPLVEVTDLHHSRQDAVGNFDILAAYMPPMLYLSFRPNTSKN